MSLWGNGAGTRAGWIYFRTNKGRSFDYGMYDWPKKTEYPVNVGSGILVGAIYNAGADIDAHGYYFLDSPIARARATDVSYPTLTFDTHQITPISLDSYSQYNSSYNPISWEFSGSHQAKRSQKWSSQIGNAFSVSLTLEAQIPTVVKVGGQFGWQLSVVSTHEAEEEDTHSLTWKVGGTLQPLEAINLVALTRRGKLSLPYSSTIVITLKNGATFSFPSSGTYEGLCYTGVEVTDAPSASRLNAKPKS
ncbi:hypothetical protein KP509_34G005700 [Ceratopteris richardii]|nr:hypothetical protein KP509_34G005700 [Ceratopteris richardii]